MTNHDEAVTRVLLSDDAGNHYLLTPELLAQARISEEVFAELTSADADDTGGFLDGRTLPPPFGSTPPPPPQINVATQANYEIKWWTLQRIDAPRRQHLWPQ